MLTLSEVASRLNVSIETVRRLVKDGSLKAVRVGNQLRVKPEELEDYIRRSATS